MAWVVDENKINKLKKDKADWEEKLADYEEDFIILSDQEIVIARVYTICDNTDHLTLSLGASIDEMSKVSEEVRVTGYNEVFDFSDLKSGGSSLLSKLKNSNLDYMDQLKSIGEQIDKLKGEVATNIQKADSMIAAIDNDINYTRTHPTIWVKD